MDFVSSVLARKLKEKGYPMVEIPTGGRDNRNAPVLYDLPKDHPNWQDCKAWWIPTISQVLKWLRKEKKILITIIPQETTLGHDTLCFGVYKITEDLYQPIYNGAVSTLMDSYEYTALAGIEYVLDNLT